METNSIRQPRRQLAQIISLTVLGTSTKSLQLHINHHGNIHAFDSSPHRIMAET